MQKSLVIRALPCELDVWVVVGVLMEFVMSFIFDSAIFDELFLSILYTKRILRNLSHFANFGLCSI